MPVYQYRIRTRAGQAQEGEAEGGSAQEVVRRLVEQDYLVVSIREKTPSLNLDVDLNELWARLRPVNTREIALFCRQLSTMIDAGVPLYEGLHILSRQSENPKFGQVIGQVAHSLQQGRTFHEALADHPDVFPEIFVHMTEAGEVGGILDEIMARMASHFEKENEIRGKIKTATIYPLIISLVAVGAVAFILGYVMPTFSTMLDSFGAELPAMTQAVLILSHWVSNYWWAGLLAAAALVLVVKRAVKIPQVRFFRDSLLLKMPIVGDVVRKVAISRFSRTLGTLLHSGVPIMTALDVVQKTVGNMVIAKGVMQARESISEGRGMAEPLRKSGVFPLLVVQMVAVGEETGSMDQLLEKISEYYDMEVDHVVSRLSTIIEPVLMVFLGGAVGFLVVSMLLPMFQLIETVGK